MAKSDALIGRRLGNYQILEKIGHGGMGVVYKARDLSLGRQVAIKVLPEHFVDDESSVQRFSREARSAALLNHPNIVTVYGVGRQESLYFIAMEYVDGESLNEVIEREGQLGVRRSLEYALQIAQALREAGRHDIVHRDIKPDNVMIDRDGRAKVMDFGLAFTGAETTKLTGTGMTLGTPVFMSPEQWMDSHVDARADIYSLGAALFMMLSGAPPFEASTPMALMRKVVDEPRPDLHKLNADIPEAVSKIVAKMMAKDPGDRYGSAAELCEVLEAYVKGIGPGAAVPVSEAIAFSSPQVERDLIRSDRANAEVKAENEARILRQQAATKFAPVQTGGPRLSRSLWIGLGIGVAVIVALGLFIVARTSGGFYDPLFPEDDFVRIEAGTFEMGSPVNEEGRSDLESLHTVTLTEGFWMGKFEVTQRQWEEVMDYNPSIFKGADLAVHQVSWDEVTLFIGALNETAGTHFRLPTEAEWEYACRGGSATPYGFEPTLEDLGDHAWYAGNSKTMVYAPGQKQPNAWGIYDMLGNVREWCQDWVGVYASSDDTDPTGPTTGTNKVHRGGSWGVEAQQCRAAARSAQHAAKGSSDLGFRLCL